MGSRNKTRNSTNREGKGQRVYTMGYESTQIFSDKH